MHVTNHALARRYRAGELVPDWMTPIILRNSRVLTDRLSVPTEFCIGSGMPWIAIVCVYDMAGGAAGRPIVTGLIVGTHEPG